jgi:DNA-binding NarL/FixJ family response regulator
MNILIVDDHAVVRQGYSALLSMMLPDVTVVEAESATQALQTLHQQRFDVVILDINLEHASGLNLAPRILTRDSQCKIIFFSMFDEVTVVNKALQCGASGYITKRCKPEIMIAAIKAVVKGECYIEHDVAINLASSGYQSNSDVCAQLTQREFDIFMGVAKGLKRAQIASDLSIADKTVSNVITQLKSKLQVTTNAELVHLAIEKGYVKVAL